MKCFYHNDADGKCAGFWVRNSARLAPNNGDMASHMSDSETSNVHHGLSVLNSDITRALLEMHSEQRPNLKWKRI